MDYEVIIYAMKLSIEADVRTINYIKAVLNNWSKKGIKTLIEAQKENQSFRNKNTVQDETEEEKNERKIKELQEAMNKCK